MNRQRFERLEQALRMWESTCFVTLMAETASRLMGETSHYSRLNQRNYWQEFRDYLFRLPPGDSFDSYRFLGDEKVAADVFGSIAFLPVFLTHWTRHSRRVYHIDHDLRTLLSLTSLQDVRWGDISWPFQSFVIHLDDPIVGVKNQQGNTPQYDTICVSQQRMRLDPNGGIYHTIQFLFLDQKLEQYIPISRIDIEEVGKDLRRGSVRKVLKLMKDHEPKISTDFFRLNMDEVGEVVLGRTSNLVLNRGVILGGGDSRRPSYVAWDEGARIVGGLCMYLQSLPPKSPHVSSWQPLEPGVKHPDPRAISTGAEVCHVSSVYRLTTEEREVVEQVGERGHYELCAHFRAGYWRRRPGTANDPTAPKVVHVRPTLVRRDRLAEGQLPGGSEQVVE